MGVADGSQTRAGAVALDDGALLVEGNAGGRGLVAVDLCVEVLRLEGDGADELGGILLSKGESTADGDVKLATLGEVVDLGDVKGDLDGLARGDALKVLLAEVLGGNGIADTVKLDILVCKLLALMTVMILRYCVSHIPAFMT